MAHESSAEGELEELKEREARLRAMMQVAFDGSIISVNGIVEEVSQRLLDLGGYTRGEVIGRQVTDFVAPEFHNTLRQRRETGSEGHFDAVALLKDGRRVEIEVVTKNYVSHGREVRLIALRDVSERRRFEEQFRQAQKMEALGRLASGVAHDFNNILTVIRSYAEMLLLEQDESHANDVVEILKAIDLGASLTHQLLAYSRRQVVELTSVDIGSVVKATEPLIQRLIGANVELVTDFDAEAGTIQAVAGQLQQVIVNLAVNARDAMPYGGTLVVRIRRVELGEVQLRDYTPARAGRYVMLSLSDSGTGIPTDIKPQIFYPFFTTKSADRGTGLGLSVVKDIVERSRGFIVVDSTMGVGTTFAIYFPAENG